MTVGLLPNELARLRAMLIDEVIYHADWHAAQATRAEGADRHLYAAATMRSVEQRMAELPLQDPLWLRYAFLWGEAGDESGRRLGELQRQLLRSYGYSPSVPEDPADFLRTLVEALQSAFAEGGPRVSAPLTR